MLGQLIRKCEHYRRTARLRIIKMAFTVIGFILFGLFIIQMPDFTVCGKKERRFTKLKDDDMELKFQQLQLAMDLQKSRLEVFEATNYALRFELEKQKKEINNMERVIRHLNETVEKQRDELDFVYKNMQGSTVNHSDKRYPDSEHDIAIDDTKSRDQNSKYI